ncbi:MAG: radical SAM family heme chaperone HemW [Clostridia bacterium]|nr:radical SAM family heme chaperone HemW [Clostridia bacterium]
MKAGLYFHIPFCVRKCAYCDFYSVSDTTSQKAYFEAMHREMEAYRGKQIPVDSVFIGGGTPSVADETEIAKLLKKARDIFDFASDTEITIELNPKTFDEKKLLVYRDAGVNRVSMGLQSANNDELKKLGRIHTAAEFLASYQLLRKMGFTNINADMMYGLPDSSIETLEKTLTFLKQLDCEHISAYALTLDENSPLYQQGYIFPDDDGVYEQYQLVCEMLSQYRHYEISNFTKDGKEPCRHNFKYWTRAPYIGFGAAAHSFFEEQRFFNPASITEYVGGAYARTPQIISGQDALFEEIMLSLRTDLGIKIEKLPDSFWTKNQKMIESYRQNGLLMIDKESIRLTEQGFFVSNAIISSFQTEID